MYPDAIHKCDINLIIDLVLLDIKKIITFDSKLTII